MAKFFDICKARAVRARDGIERPEIYTALLIVLVGFAAFGLGRLSAFEAQKQAVRIEYPVAQEDLVGARTSGQAAQAAAIGAAKTPGDTALAPGGQLVASKSGSKYHFPWCPGAKQIAEGNKTWFNSAEEARSRGYEPAKNCKGLE